MTRTQIAVFATAGIGAAGGWLNALTDSESVRFIYPIALLAVLFWWLHYDSITRNSPRSALFSIGIVALALVFVPIYLVRSRPPGARLRAVMGFVGVLAVYGMAHLLGHLVTSAVT